MSKYILSIDPGIADLGIAMYKDNKLIHAEHVKPMESSQPKDKHQNMIQMSLGFEQVIAPILGIVKKKDSLDVVIELAVAGSFMATFLRMAFVAGVAVGVFASKARYFCPQASQWKVSKKKEPTHEHYFKDITQEEMEIVQTAVLGLKKAETHDVFDAVCIGQWFIMNKIGDR